MTFADPTGLRPARNADAARVVAPTRAADDGLPSRRVIVALLLVFAALTLIPIFREPIVRTQEARVLETARQMLESGDPRQWLLPELNGEPRLRKPPLCYWYTAASFWLFGSVAEWAGRVPALLLAWASIGVTYLFGRDLGGRRMGFYAAAIFASGTLFLRFTRTDETDVPAMLGVLIAFRAIAAATRPDAPRGRAIAQFHVAALGIAFAALSKGAPATFPVAFLLLTAIADRSWRPILDFLRSGAPVTAIALIAPWYVAATLAPGGAQVGEEVGVVLGGTNHFGLFYEYVPPLAIALAPWTGWFVLALLAAWDTRRTPDRARRVAVISVLSVAIPLSLALNVQRHYLVPILPMAALLTAWFVTRLTARPDEAPSAETTSAGETSAGESPAGATFDPRLAEASRWILAVAVIGLAGGGVATLFVNDHAPGRLPALPVLLGSAALIAAAAWLIVRFRDAPPRRQLAAFAVAAVWAMPVAIGLADSSGRAEPVRSVVASARQALRAHFGGAEPGPFLMGGDRPSPTMSYYLRTSLRAADEPALIADFLARHPRGVVIVERSEKPREGVPAVVLPPGLTRIHAGRTDEREVTEFYARADAATPTTSPEMAPPATTRP